MADATRLFYNGRLMLTITSSSLFRSMPGVPLQTAEQREKAAIIQKDGWVQNAGYDPKLFEIIHGKTEPMVLSKVTADIIERSRQ